MPATLETPSEHFPALTPAERDNLKYRGITPPPRRPSNPSSGENAGIQAINEAVQQTSDLGAPAAAGNRPRHRRPEISRRPAPRRPARQWPCAARRRARPGQDALACARWPPPSRRNFQRIQFTPDMLPADIVGTHDLQSARRHLRHQARPDLRQPRPRGRNQPRARQGAERAARSDAGAPGHARQRDLQVARAVPGAGHAKPDRAGRHLSAARGAGRSLHAEGRRRLSEPQRRNAPSWTPWPPREPNLAVAAGRHRRGHHAGAPSRQLDLHRREGARLHRRSRPRHARPEGYGLDLGGYIQYGASPARARST